MTDDATARLALPLIQPGQAQKELYHNEALALLDLATQAVVEAVGIDTPPTAPTPGDCWVVGAAPTGAWAGHAAAIAGWTGGGWRFVAAREGMAVWDRDQGQPVRFDGANWQTGVIAARRLEVGGRQVVGPRQPGVAEPAGGATVDSEARGAIGAILLALRTHGLIDA